MGLSPVSAEFDLDWRFLAVAGVIVAGVVWYTRRQVTQAGQTIVDAVAAIPHENPLSRGFDEVGKAVTGKADWTGGGSLWELGHREVVDPLTGYVRTEANWFGRVLDAVAMP